MRFRILQIKDISKTPYAFFDYDNDLFSFEDYEITYESTIVERPILGMLDDIFYDFNANKPLDFKGHSLSVSDLVWLENGQIYYCNGVGWKLVTVKKFAE